MAGLAIAQRVTDGLAPFFQHIKDNPSFELPIQPQHPIFNLVTWRIYQRCVKCNDTIFATYSDQRLRASRAHKDYDTYFCCKCCQMFEELVAQYYPAEGKSTREWETFSSFVGYYFSGQN